jgi:hypothetical protein
MNTPTAEPTDNLKLLRDSPEFSLFAGGPLFRLLFRARKSEDELFRMRRSAVVFLALLAWLPLLALSAIKGQLFSGSVGVPFLSDLEVHTRLLLALPLLIIAEFATQQRMRPLLWQFLERNLIPKHAVQRFEAAITSAFRLRNSVVAEVLLLAFVYAVGVLIVWRHYMTLDTDTWYATLSGEGSKLSLAGLWYGCVSLPIFQFLLCRWYFRLFIWARFLWQVSGIELSLIPTHPDRVGGLGFLSNTAKAFSVLAAAHGTLLAGYIATRVLFLDAELSEFRVEIAVMVIFVLFVTLAPLLVFAPQLSRMMQKGLREYGALAARYVGEFDAKWVRGGAPSQERLVGSADIQSLADLSNSYEVVRTTRIAPITKDVVIRLAIATLVPLAPLLLTIMPLEELMKKLVAILLK